VTGVIEAKKAKKFEEFNWRLEVSDWRYQNSKIRLEIADRCLSLIQVDRLLNDFIDIYPI
jgi:hypothetical protein